MEVDAMGRRLIWVSCQVLLTLTVVTVANAQLGFGKSFNPGTIGPGSTTTLQFDISNVETGFPVTAMAFTDTLPAGMEIATPSGAASTCGGVLDAPDGGTTISFGEGEVGLDSECSITVNVTSSTVGMHSNVTGDLTSSAGNSGGASATLTVDGGRPGFVKSFVPSSIPAGGTSVLTLTVDNSVNGAGADNLSFTDPLPAGMVVATPANASTDCTGGQFPVTLTAVPGTSVISMFGGFVGAESTCTVTVDVTAELPGEYVNTTFELTNGFSTAVVPSGFATALLDIPINFLIKSFTDDPVAPGSTVTLEFSINNPDRTSAASNISFTDDLDATLPGLVATGLPRADVCGAGSQLLGADVVGLVGGRVPPGGSCNFDVTLQVPAEAPSGAFENTTSEITAIIGGAAVIGNSATDTLIVRTAPRLTKTFLDDPVASGDTVKLGFTIQNTSSISSTFDIAFDDNLDAVFPGLRANGLPLNDVCGDGSTITTAFFPFEQQGFSLTGGTLAAGGSCTFDVDLQVPAAIPSGTYVNTTSVVTAMVGETLMEGLPATDFLEVVGPPTLIKSFTDDPVVPGSTVSLEFSLTYGAESPGDSSGIAFTDDLTNTLPGLLAITPLPLVNVCGAGSQLGGTATNLTFTGGSLSPGTSCTFAVTLEVPAQTQSGNYTNTTSNVTAGVLGLGVTGNAATDVLEVAALSLAKSFTDDPVLPGGTVTLEFTLQNQSPNASATNISFSDSLSSTLSGLVAINPTQNDVCGQGSQLTGTSFLFFTGGSLGPGESCTFAATLSVPAAAEAGDYPNTTSQVTASIDGIGAVVNGAADRLSVILPLEIFKSFTDDPVSPGDTATLEFTLTNAHPLEGATDLAFSDDLEATLSGLVAVGLPLSDVCGAGSQLTGTAFLDFSGGSLGPGGSCTFSIPVEVPADAPSATAFTNTTSDVTGVVSDIQTSGDPATDELQIEICLAPDGENVTLQDDTVLDTQSFEVCKTIEVGPNYEVIGPQGFLTLRAGHAVIFRNGASVGIDGRLIVGLLGAPE
jgi:uncharacterized repeat protein (TIGR01451 family)